MVKKLMTKKAVSSTDWAAHPARCNLFSGLLIHLRPKFGDRAVEYGTRPGLQHNAALELSFVLDQARI